MALSATEAARLDALQSALEAEAQALEQQLHHIRRSLEHLKATRHELRTGKPLHWWMPAFREEHDL